jgi:DNA-binding transcriptional LysR family regulator
MNDLSMMRPAAWQLFLDLAKEGSLSRLALRQERAQPQLSRQLAELEAACGTPLFVRHARGLQLSEYGQWVLPLVRGWLAQTQALQDEIRHGVGVAVGEVRLGVIPSAVGPVVMPALAALRLNHPLVRLTITEALDSLMDHSLQSASVDMAVRYVHPAGLRAGDQVLQSVGTYLVGPPGDALTRRKTVPFACLQGLPLVVPCKPSAWRDTLDGLAQQQGFALQVALEADSLRVQKDSAMQGVAHTLLGPLALEPERSQKRLQVALVVAPALPRLIVLTMRPGLTPNLAHRAVVDAIMASAQAQPGPAA